jgi:hypothetical protein
MVLVRLLVFVAVLCAAVVGAALKPYWDYRAYIENAADASAHYAVTAGLRVYRVDPHSEEYPFYQQLKPTSQPGITIGLPQGYTRSEWKGARAYQNAEGHTIVVLPAGKEPLKAWVLGSGYTWRPWLPSGLQQKVESWLGGGQALFVQWVLRGIKVAPERGITAFRVGPYEGLRIEREWIVYEILRDEQLVAAVAFSQQAHRLSDIQEAMVIASLQLDEVG